MMSRLLRWLQIISSIVHVARSISVAVTGENVYSIPHNNLQYFVFIEDKDATITCSVSQSPSRPIISFKKAGEPLVGVLPDTLYDLTEDQQGDSYSLVLKIYSSGYTDIVGNWACDVAGATPEPFKTLITRKPHISTAPALVAGVAREGTTITMQCHCDSLDELAQGRTWGWLVDGSSPVGSKISFQGPGSENGYATELMVISNLDDLDSAEYRCSCKVGRHVELTSAILQMTVMRPPGTPRNIGKVRSDMDSLEISWENSKYMGVVLEYKISYCKLGADSYREVTTGPENAYTLRSLEPLTRYSVKVAASNNAGTGPYSQTVSFNTSQPSESRPSISIPRDYIRDENSETLLLDVGQGVDFNLPCEVRSYPRSMVQWYFNGQSVEEGDQPANFRESVIDIDQFKTVHTLNVRTSSADSSGMYRCVATNIRGTSHLTFSVRVAGDSGENTATEASRDSSSGALPLTLLFPLLLLLLLLPLPLRIQP